MTCFCEKQFEPILPFVQQIFSRSHPYFPTTHSQLTVLISQNYQICDFLKNNPLLKDHFHHWLDTFLKNRGLVFLIKTQEFHLELPKSQQLSIPCFSNKDTRFYSNHQHPFFTQITSSKTTNDISPRSESPLPSNSSTPSSSPNSFSMDPSIYFETETVTKSTKSVTQPNLVLEIQPVQVMMESVPHCTSLNTKSKLQFDGQVANNFIRDDHFLRIVESLSCLSFTIPNFYQSDDVINFLMNLSLEDRLHLFQYFQPSSNCDPFMSLIYLNLIQQSSQVLNHLNSANSLKIFLSTFCLEFKNPLANSTILYLNQLSKFCSQSTISLNGSTFDSLNNSMNVFDTQSKYLIT